MKYISAVVDKDKDAFTDEVKLSIDEKLSIIKDKIKQNVLSMMFEESIDDNDYDEFIDMLESNDIEYSIEDDYIIIDDTLNEAIDTFLIEKAKKRKFSKKRVKFNIAGAGKRGSTVKRKIKVIVPSGKKKVRGKNTFKSQTASDKRSIRKREKSKKRSSKKGLHRRNVKIGIEKRKKTKR